MNDIKIFENEQFGKIRTAGTADNPLFCLADICRVLGIKNVSDCKSRLKSDGVVLTEGVSKTTNQHGTTTEQKVSMTFINEQNLYRLIMRSDKPIAEPFQDWVCGDVLPTIRKTGYYGVPQTFAEALRLAADQQEKIEQQQKQLAEQQPKVVLADAFTASLGSFPLKDLATILSQRGINIGTNRLYDYLRENYYLGERGQYRNVAYQKYVDQGLFEIEMTPSVNACGVSVVNKKTMITPKGIEYFVNKFLNNKNNK